jgi:hypothetical protein
MRRALLVACLGLVTAAGCSETTRPVVSSPVVGRWVRQENLQPMGRMTRLLVFRNDGTFSLATDMYGIYGGTGLAAYTHTSGTYEIDGDRVICTATKEVTWDSFYGRTSPETVRQINSVVFPEARFKVAALTLTLDYLSYPADAPEPTTLSFTLLGLD